MRVNDFGPSNKIGRYANEPTSGAEEAAQKNGRAPKGSTPETPTDTVELSSRSLDVAYTRKIIEATPEVRQDKVAAIKARIENGTYEVKSQETADKLLIEALGEIL